MGLVCQGCLRQAKLGRLSAGQLQYASVCSAQAASWGRHATSTGTHLDFTAHRADSLVSFELCEPSDLHPCMTCGIVPQAAKPCVLACCNPQSLLAPGELLHTQKPHLQGYVQQ